MIKTTQFLIQNITKTKKSKKLKLIRTEKKKNKTKKYIVQFSRFHQIYTQPFISRLVTFISVLLEQ